MIRRKTGYWLLLLIWVCNLAIEMLALTVAPPVSVARIITTAFLTTFVSFRIGVASYGLYLRRPRAWIETTKQEDFDS